MLRRLIKTGSSCGCYTQISRTVHVSSIFHIPRGAFTPPQIVKTRNDAKDDVTALAEVESNLFANTEKQHKPVNSKELLRQYAPDFPPLKKKVPPKKESTTTDKPKESASKKKSSSRVINDTELGLEYVRLTLDDPLLSALMLSAKSRKHREKNQQIVVEGRRLILDAIECKYKMQSLLFSQKDQLALVKDKIKQLKNVQIIRVPQHNLKAWSTLTTCPGIIAIFNRPGNSKEFVPRSKPLPITVVCDNIREPNNLGSIIRSCAAIPCTQVLVLKGCCDPWDTKALRGGCGGQFRVQIKDNIVWERLRELLPDNFSLFIAENKLNRIEDNDQGRCPVVPYTEVDMNSEHNVLVIGGETHGVSDDAYRFLESHRIGSCVHVPIAEGVDSLNTASALTLILFEMRKLILDKFLTTDLQQQAEAT